MRLLVITSTVNVNSNFTVLVDPEIRLQQYVSSILFYIKVKNIDSIIICDNSGYDYSTSAPILKLAEEYSKKIECLSFLSDNEKTLKYGKGYGEGEILSFVSSSSVLYKKADSFFKVTGRIIVSNIETVVRFTPSNRNCFQRLYFNPSQKEKKTDTRFYHIIKNDFEKYLINSYKEVNDNEGFYLEHCFYKSIVKNKIPFSFFFILPYLKGISGSSGVNYEIPKKNYVIRSVANFFLNVFNK